jgi:hypothetical protein
LPPPLHPALGIENQAFGQQKKGKQLPQIFL